LKFIKSREFFDRLKDLNIRKNGEPHKNLVEFLTIDSKTYKTGLVVKKIEKLSLIEKAGAGLDKY